MITIKNITIAELSGFIQSNEYRKMSVIPISRHRALSHVFNPHARPDDKVLFMAYYNNKFVGYLGAMPDELTINNEKIRIAWLSCMWVDSSMRGKGIAPQLLKHAHEIWDGNLLITNFIPVAKRAYDKTGLFTEFKILDGVRGYLRFNLNEILVAKKPGLKRIQRLLLFADWLLNIPNGLRLTNWKKRSSPGKIIFEYINEIDGETYTFISKFSEGHFTPKTSHEFHWMIKYPWILDAPYDDLNARRYDFSSRIYNFKQFFIKVYDVDYKVIAFLMLTSRGTHLKTPYLYYNDKDVDVVKRLVFAHAMKTGTKTLSTFDHALAISVKSGKNPFILCRNMQFKILISKKLKEKLGNTEKLFFYEGDGDAAFV